MVLSADVFDRTFAERLLPSGAVINKVAPLDRKISRSIKGLHGGDLREHRCDGGVPQRCQTKVVFILSTFCILVVNTNISYYK